MQRIPRFFRAFALVFRSIPYVLRHGLLGFFVLPGLLGLVMGTLLALGVFAGAAVLMEHALQTLTSIRPWMMAIIRVVAFAGAAIFFAMSWRLIASLFILPALGSLQDRLEVLHLGRARPTLFRDDARNALRGGGLALLQLAGLPIVALVSLALGPFSPVPLALYDGYFLGTGIFDAMLEREFPRASGRRQCMRTLRPEMLGVGLASLALLLIPVLGLFLSSGMGLVAAFRLRYEPASRHPPITRWQAAEKAACR